MRDVMLSQDCVYTLVERSLEGDQARRIRRGPAINSVAEFDSQPSIRQEDIPDFIAVQKFGI
jgi:hypothetical protein